MKLKLAQLEIWVPAGVPWAASDGAASNPTARRKAAAQAAAVWLRRAYPLLSTARGPSRMAPSSLVDADAQLERGAGARRQKAAPAPVVTGPGLPRHRNPPTRARARPDIRHL